MENCMEKSNLDCGFFRIVPSEMTIGQWTHERRRAELIRDDYERGENKRRFQKLLLEKNALHRHAAHAALHRCS